MEIKMKERQKERNTKVRNNEINKKKETLKIGIQITKKKLKTGTKEETKKTENR
jgi:hypothetical protein